MESDFGPDFKNKYQVVFLPTVMILDKHGNLKFKIDRLASSEELLALSKHYQEKVYPSSIVSQPIAQAPTRPTTSTAKVKKTKPAVSKVKVNAPPTAAPAQKEKIEISIFAFFIPQSESQIT